MFLIFAGRRKHRKKHRQYSRDVRGCCSDKKEGIFLRVDIFKDKNQHHLNPQQAGFMVNRNRISVMVVPK